MNYLRELNLKLIIYCSFWGVLQLMFSGYIMEYVSFNLILSPKQLSRHIVHFPKKISGLNISWTMSRREVDKEKFPPQLHFACKIIFVQVSFKLFQ